MAPAVGAPHTCRGEAARGRARGEGSSSSGGAQPAPPAGLGTPAAVGPAAGERRGRAGRRRDGGPQLAAAGARAEPAGRRTAFRGRARRGPGHPLSRPRCRSLRPAPGLHPPARLHRAPGRARLRRHRAGAPLGPAAGAAGPGALRHLPRAQPGRPAAAGLPRRRAVRRAPAAPRLRALRRGAAAAGRRAALHREPRAARSRRADAQPRR